MRRNTNTLTDAEVIVDGEWNRKESPTMADCVMKEQCTASIVHVENRLQH
jgi:hypothetical protein